MLRLLMVFALVAATCAKMSMEISQGVERCVGQNLDEEDEATFTLASEEQPHHKVIPKHNMMNEVVARVKDPDGKVVQEKTISSDKVIDFYMRINKRGVYEMCFLATRVSEGNVVRVSFAVAYKNRQAGSGRLKFKNDGGAGDPSKKVLKEEIPVLEEMLQDAEATLAHLSKEIEFAQRQESELLAAGDAASNRIKWFGWLSMGILVTTSLWQIAYLRHFFASKKLL